MNVRKFTPMMVLFSSVALGYLIISRACLDYSEPTSTAQTAATFDDTCSAASPDAVTCEMPEEISRADYFRMVAMEGNTKAKVVVDSGEILVESSPQSFNSATVVDQTIKGIRVERKLPEAFPMLGTPKKEAE
jgi:hypothetical protein